MYLPCLLAAPTVVRLGRGRRRRPYLARPLSLAGLATLLRAAADELGLDGDGGELPRFGSAEFQGWLDGPGAGLVFWCALHGDQPEVGIARAEALAARADDDDRAAVLAAALRRARRPEELGTNGRAEATDHDWTAALYRYYEDGVLPDQVGALTLDQADAIASRGKGGEALSESNRTALQAAWEEAERARRAAEAEAQAPPDPAPTPVTVADHGWQFTPDDAPEGA